MKVDVHQHWHIDSAGFCAIGLVDDQTVDESR